ncbi:MAG: ATP-binding protein [Nanoarchaeota archaeon]
MEIEDLNPWWITGKVQEEFQNTEKKEMFNEVCKFLSKRQVLAITGMRRTGKSYLIYQLIEELLKSTKKENILYVSFDLISDKIETFLQAYKEIVGVDYSKEKIYVFLDEIQKREGWENELKLFYDNYPNIKFIITGSARLLIEKKKGESLAGRIYTFISKPLSFREYLRIKKSEIDLDKPLLYKEKIKKEFQHYLLVGGFPELIFEKDRAVIFKYIKETVIDRIIFLDIPSCFDIDEPELLRRIFAIISANPGMIVDYTNLASDLDRSRRTISKYLDFLEKSFLIRKIFNYSKNKLTSEKKSKKIYPSSTGFGYFYSADEGKIIESYVANFFETEFFYRKLSKEIDFVLEGVLIEVKYRNDVKERDLKFVKKFLKENKFKRLLIITKDLKKKDKKVLYFPVCFLGLVDF